MPIARKRFGQHFLHDQFVISQIIDAFAPQASDHLLEIGPGQGALTYPVLKAVGQLEAIEIDRDLARRLSEQASQYGQLMLHQGDVLTFDFHQLKTDQRLLRVFGNLPYNISSPLIFHLLQFADDISDMTFMLQKEMAERMTAAVDTEHYGRLSVMVQYYCQTHFLFDVPPEAFTPPPKVVSSVIHLHPYRRFPHHAQDQKLFERLVKQAFSMRRKTLHNNLKGWINDQALLQAGIDPIRRAETVSVEEFVRLSNVVVELP